MSWAITQNLSSYAALTKKRKISDSRPFTWCAEHLYTPYTFELCLMKKKKEEKEQNLNIAVRFSQLCGEVMELLGLYLT